MPDPANCPECEEKIILNGGIAEKVLGETCYTIKRFVDSGKKFPDALKLVEMANKLEDDAFAFQKEVLTQMGFKGPWPKSMS
jgi:hypothetical protein